MSEVQVKGQFLKALPAVGNSDALEMPAPLILVLKSFCSVMIGFFVGFFFILGTNCMIDRDWFWIFVSLNILNLYS